MIRALSIVLALSLLAVNGNAEWWSPSVRGNAPDSSVVAVMSSATLVTAAMEPFVGPGILYGVHLSSGANDSFVVFRDTAGASTTSPALTSVLFSSSSQQIQFNPPLRIYNGLSTNASACLAGVGANTTLGRCYTVLFDSFPD